ncbi:hypothetical protein FA13DRAFT_51351 [Coprinellus micaceus]|uniref:F-box domain-containing protein n=1 Tax=Coprinellus micaceus TaxID=71717 RepID=A0A4Y7U0W8_COPMI|nr:hypothetical protein FA13DRAFT_51351 [Coprinellus micaceus]
MQSGGPDMDQHLSRILSTNAPPNALETSSLETRMNDLNTKVTQLRSQLQELEKLEGQLCQYRGALSPIRRIPPEVLREIFRYVLPSVEDAGSEGVVVELGLVCKGWREVTFGVHRFWSHLTVRKLVGRHDETVAWLSRSGTLPRTLRLEWAWGGSPHKCSKGSCCLSSVEAVKLLGSGPEIQHLALPQWNLQNPPRFSLASRLSAPLLSPCHASTPRSSKLCSRGSVDSTYLKLSSNASHFSSSSAIGMEIIFSTS